MNDRNNDRPKKSWREIDAGRDRSRPSSSAPSGSDHGPRSADQASRQHRAALEALFARGDLGKLIAEKLAPVEAKASEVKVGEPAAAVEAAGAATTAEAPAKVPAVEVGTRPALRKKIIEAVGRDQISRAVDRFVEQHGLPSDFETLEQALDHNREERVMEVLGALEKLLAKEKPKRSRGLAGKLRFIEETTHDADLRSRAADVRRRLG